MSNKHTIMKVAAIASSVTLAGLYVGWQAMANRAAAPGESPGGSAEHRDVLMPGSKSAGVAVEWQTLGAGEASGGATATEAATVGEPRADTTTAADADAAPIRLLPGSKSDQVEVPPVPPAYLRPRTPAPETTRPVTAPPNPPSTTPRTLLPGSKSAAIVIPDSPPPTPSQSQPRASPPPPQAPRVLLPGSKSFVVAPPDSQPAPRQPQTAPKQQQRAAPKQAVQSR